MKTQTIMGLDATIVVLMALAGAGCIVGAMMLCIARREEQQDGESVGDLAELVLVTVSLLVFCGGGFLYWVGLQENRSE